MGGIVVPGHGTAMETRALSEKKRGGEVPNFMSQMQTVFLNVEHDPIMSSSFISFIAQKSKKITGLYRLYIFIFVRVPISGSFYAAMPLLFFPMPKGRHLMKKAHSSNEAINSQGMPSLVHPSAGNDMPWLPWHTMTYHDYDHYMMIMMWYMVIWEQEEWQSLPEFEQWTSTLSASVHQLFF